MTGPTADRLRSLTKASVRTLVASERAVEKAAVRQFHDARLVASLAAGLLLVGFLLVAQWRGVETFEQQLESRTDQELAQIVSELGAENDELRREALRLEQRIDEAEATTEGRATVLNEAARELQALRVLTGLEGATGPGVSVRISDPRHVVLASDLVDVVNELRAAGAEAVEVDGVRIGATTGIRDDDGLVLIDGVAVGGDVLVLAIGEPGTLSQALGMPGGLVSTIGSFPGVSVDVFERDEIEVGPAVIRTLEHGEPYEAE